MPIRHRISPLGVAAALLAVSAIGANRPSLAQTAEPSTSVKDHPLGEQTMRLPRHFADGADLPNGWRITPAGKVIATVGDLITNLTVSPDGKIVVSLNSGFLPHGLDVFDAITHKQLQHIKLTSAWLGMAWSSDGHTLFVSGGNASGSKSKSDPVAPIYLFSYANGLLSNEPTGRLVETIDPKEVSWSGVAYLPGKHWLYAANRGTGENPSNVVVFDAETHKIVTRIPVEVSPYQVLLSADGRRLFVSNWSSESISIIDTNNNKVLRTLHVGMNPNDLKLSADGRLFIACSNDNTVWVIDTHTLQVTERLSTTMTPLAPEGSTPNALAIDNTHHLLYIANADNNSIAVASIDNRTHSTIVGFIPTGWYPSALALADHNGTLYIGNTKGEEGHPDPLGPHSPLTERDIPFSEAAPGSSISPFASGIFSQGRGSVHTVQTGSIEMLSVVGLKEKLQGWTRQVAKNTPYKDSLLAETKKPLEPSILPQSVGEPSPIKHIIYIIKENRSYDQVFGDIPGSNGDPRLAIFGEKVTPNQHALAKEYVVLDNLYCDGEVSQDGHFWSTAAYATDFNEKQWPARYAGITKGEYLTHAEIPSGGFIWDLARRKGLTYHIYEEMTTSAKNGSVWEATPAPGMDGLYGHYTKEFAGDIAVRDGEKVKIFLREFDEWANNYDSSDAGKRLPNLIVMRMLEDHTVGTRPGWNTPTAMVADNDYAIGQLVDTVTHSRYWPNTAIFIIEDDAQDGADHIDARRTVGLVLSPYVKRGIVDSTLYTTSSMLRSMELLLGLPPMSQYDAAAMPLFASFGTMPVMKPFNRIAPLVDTNEKNTKDSAGAKQSSRMDFSGVDRAPMHALNEIIWKSVKGKDSVMPPPVHRFRPIVDVSGSGKDDDRY
ncbi:MAG TPA: alkaline phosphatase family protein [Acidisarcina sp.]|nr:alkaline phosphatase family protein [Acidisarcina sp.]